MVEGLRGAKRGGELLWREEEEARERRWKEREWEEREERGSIEGRREGRRELYGSKGRRAARRGGKSVCSVLFTINNSAQWCSAVSAVAQWVGYYM